MSESTFRIDERGINELFHGPTGDVHKWQVRNGRQIVMIAKRVVGKDTRATMRSIRARVMRAPDACVLEVSATSKAALYHHEGTRPHTMTSRPGRALRFKQGGRVVYAQRIFSPGTRPNPYLVTAMRAVIK